MAKKKYAEGSFGEYFIQLLQRYNYTQARFISELKISKTYLIEVLDGRQKPPSHDMQERILELLKLEGHERHEFYDRVAKGRQELPKDVVDYLIKNPERITKLREEMRG